MDLKQTLVTSGFLIFCGCFSPLIAQNTVTIGGEKINEKAILMLVAPNSDQGFILPRVDDKSLIAPGIEDAGMVVYDNNDHKIYFWNGTTWKAMGIPAAGDISYDNSSSGLASTNVQGALDALTSSSTITQWTLDSTNVYFNKGNVGIGLTEPTAKMHIALDSLDTLTSKGIIVNNSSPSTSSLYGSQLWLTGSGTSSKIGEYINIDNGSGSKVGQGIVINQNADQITWGQNIQVSGTSDGQSAGSYVINNIQGTSDKFGMFTGVGAGSGSNTGLYTYVSGGTGSGMGVRSLIENTSAPSTGMYSEISNTTNVSSKGFHSKILDGGEMVGFESEIVQDNDILQSYGVKSDIVNNASQVETYGIFSTISGTGPGEVNGLYSELTGTGSALKFGARTRVYGGNGTKTGVSTDVIETTDTDSYGFYADIQNTLSGAAYGSYHTVTQIFGGRKYGVYSYLEGENNSVLTGSEVLLTHNGAGGSEGYESSLYGPSSGSKTGFRSNIESGDGGKTGYKSNITTDGQEPVYGFHSYIRDDNNTALSGQTGTIGLRLEVDNFSENLAIGISSSGDDLNVFGGRIAAAGGYSVKNWTISSGTDESTSLDLIYTGVLNAPYVAGFFDTDGRYFDISDRRLKKNISYLGDILDKVMSLKPTQYQFINIHENAQSIGFIAQEVKAYFPELVSIKEGNGYEDFHALNYDGFGVIAIKAIQEQQELIEEQAIRIIDLEERLAKIEQFLNQ